MLRQFSAFFVLFLATLGGTLYLLKGKGAGAPSPQGSAALQCGRHKIAEASCPWCHPELKESLGLCGEHGVPEALCSRCRPALIEGFKVENDWCGEHSLPESQCLICNPGLAAEELTEEAKASAESPALEGGLASGVPRYKSRPSASCRTGSMKIQFRAADTEKAAGIECQAVVRVDVQEKRSYYAELDYDRQSYALASTAVSGSIKELCKKPGDQVHVGEVLALIDSPEVGRAKAQLLRAQSVLALARRSLERERGLLDKQISTERARFAAEQQLQQSEIDLTEARQALRSLGYSEAQIDEIKDGGGTGSIMAILAPISGLIIERKASTGQFLDCGQTIFELTDLSKVWANAEVNPEDVCDLRLGQSCVFEDASAGGDRHAGSLIWIGSALSPHSRMAKIRGEVANPSQALRAKSIGRLIIPFGRLNSLIVPLEAVQWEGCCNVVFLRRSASLFEARKVKLSFRSESYYIVEDGLREGDEVVTTGSFLLKTELLKSSIGAGCCDEK